MNKIHFGLAVANQGNIRRHIGKQLEVMRKLIDQPETKAGLYPQLFANGVPE
jgi:hypothetical protein